MSWTLHTAFYSSILNSYLHRIIIIAILCITTAATLHNCTGWSNSWNKAGSSPLISGLLLFNAKTNLQAGRIFRQRVVSPKAHLNTEPVAHYKQWQQCFLLAPWSCLVWTMVSSDPCSLFRWPGCKYAEYIKLLFWTCSCSGDFKAGKRQLESDQA